MKKLLFLILISITFAFFSGCSWIDTESETFPENGEPALKKGKKHEVPIKGKFDVHTVEMIEDEENPILYHTLSGIGNLTHLGHSTMTFVEEVDMSTLPWTVTVKSSFNAANGDELTADCTSVVDPTNYPHLKIVGVGEFSGGTGRFENATGELHYNATYNGASGKGHINITGKIKY